MSETTTLPPPEAPSDPLATLRQVRDKAFLASETMLTQREAYLAAVRAGDEAAAAVARTSLIAAQLDLAVLAERERQLKDEVRGAGFEPPRPDLRLLFRYFPASAVVRATDFERMRA